MTSAPVEATTPISATLQAQEWNALMAILYDAPAPYRITAPLIAKLSQQIQTGAAALPVAQPNGADAHVSN